MRRVVHPLESATPGRSHEVVSHHYGPAVRGRKVYIQAGLHADETPAMLVATVLQRRLAALETEGALRAEVVVVSVANPIGLGQTHLGAFIGRFDFASGRNFNRGYPMVHDEVAQAVESQLGDDGERNLELIRAAWRQALERRAPVGEHESLQRTLMLLAHDASVMLDLHCSLLASMHLYTGEVLWPEVEPLARYLGAQASLLAIDTQAASFDEAHSATWWHLQQRFGARFPIPHGSIAVTVEHRGQQDVSHELAQQDAAAILGYLTHRGTIAGEAPPLPPLLAPATPLAGSEQFHAPISGILVYRAKVGDRIEPGQPMFDIVDPLDGSRVTLESHTHGVFYMGRDVRFARRGDPIGRISGDQVMRTGPLLGP